MKQLQPFDGMSRRDLLTLIGMTAGSAAMYQAMTSLGFAAESGYKGPVKLEGDPKGASVLILGAGLAGMTAALELRQAGYKVQILEYNEPAGRPELDACAAATPTPSSAARPRNASSTRASTSIPARGASPITTTACSITASGLGVHARTVPAAQPQRLPAFDQGVRRQAAARPRHQDRFPAAMSSELLAKVTQKGKLERRRHQGGPGDPARGAAVLGRARQGLCLQGRPASRPSSAGFEKDPGGGLGAAPMPSDPDRLLRHPERRACGAAWRISRSTSSRPPCSSRSAAWT